MVEMDRPMKIIKVGEKTIPIEIVEAKLQGYIERRRKQGCVVKIIKPIYYKGLNQIRCVLAIDHMKVRMFFYTAIDDWRQA